MATPELRDELACAARDQDQERAASVVEQLKRAGASGRETAVVGPAAWSDMHAALSRSPRVNDRLLSVAVTQRGLASS